MKKFLCFTIMLFLLIFLPNKANAACSDSEIIRLQNIAKNVNYSYEYNEETNNFSIVFTNLKKDIIIKNVISNKNYNTDKELKINDIYSGSYKFNIYAKDNKCTKDILITKYINLPYYNTYYNSELCDGIENYSYCNKWIKNNISYDIWYSNVTDYRNNLKQENKKQEDVRGIFDKIGEVIIKIYVNYYYIILPLIIIILCVVIYKKNKKENLI